MPESVPATTVDRQCGSSQQALHFAAQGVLAGAYDLALAVGVESMSRAPMGSATGSSDPFGQRLGSRYLEGLIPQGISSELIAQKWGISRDDADEFAAASRRKAAAATEEGWLEEEIAPVERAGLGVVVRDEGIRPDTTVERLAGLKPAFQHEDWERRFPGLPWVTTAGKRESDHRRSGSVDAEKLGIADGSTARLTTRRSGAVVTVAVDDSMQAGHVALPNGFGLDHVEAGARRQTGVAPNELTASDDRDPWAGTPWHKSVPARLEPA